MDPKFHPAIAAIKAGDLNELKSLLSQDPSLATARSSLSHPTLLQCLVLDFVDLPNKIEMAHALVDAGAEINGPLVAAASIGNIEAVESLLSAGAEINGIGNWSPLEEALYWGNQNVIDLLLERGIEPGERLLDLLAFRDVDDGAPAVAGACSARSPPPRS